jgi:AAA ATPase domain
LKLLRFRILNFRSINDSGLIDVAKITTLVGRNESGKSNLLLGLLSLNPPSGLKSLVPIKDFPRHRRLSECTDNTPVVETQWQLIEAEREALAALLPRAREVTEVHIGRYYQAKRWVNFPGLKPIDFALRDVLTSVRKIKPAALAAGKLEDGSRAKLDASIIKFETEISQGNSGAVWVQTAVPALAALRQALANVGAVLPENEEKLLTALEEKAADISGDMQAQQQARDWAIGRLPIFVYLEEYPELDGHQDVAAYLDRKSKGQQTPADRNFEKLCVVADISAEQLHKLQQENQHETRNQLVNRSGAIVTSEIRRLWKDRPLKVRFNLDAQHLDTLISDPNAVYDVEVNLDERSRGFKWFLSFYVTFTADTKGGSAENAVLLLDEPGLYLHAASQGDLLRHLAADFSNQIVYTTHSPFMVPTDNLDAVRTVNIGQEAGTTVTNDPTGDARTLFPLQAALGYHLSQSLFIGPTNLVVEGVTDYWLLTAASEYLASTGRTGLPKNITVTPAGGAQKVSYMVALLSSERLNVLVLLDQEKQARAAKDELVKSKLIREENVVFTSEAFPSSASADCDVEDILDVDVYEAAVRESYKAELRGKKLVLNPNVPRVAKRVELAFTDLGLEFHKTRPARYLLRLMATDPDKVLTSTAISRFEALFGVISDRLTRHMARSPAPFL